MGSYGNQGDLSMADSNLVEFYEITCEGEIGVIVWESFHLEGKYVSGVSQYHIMTPATQRSSIPDDTDTVTEDA